MKLERMKDEGKIAAWEDSSTEEKSIGKNIQVKWEIPELEM